MNNNVEGDRLPTLMRLHMKEQLPSRLGLRATHEKSHLWLKKAGKIERGGGEKKLPEPLSSALREEKQIPHSCKSRRIRAFLQSSLSSLSDETESLH